MRLGKTPYCLSIGLCVFLLASAVSLWAQSPRFVYVANSDTNSVSAYIINPATGALSPVSGSPFSTGSAPQGVVAEPRGKFLCVTNLNSNNVSAYSIDPASGTLSPVSGSPFSSDIGPVAALADPSGKFLYVANQGMNPNTVPTDISAYTIDATTGALTAVRGSPFQLGLFFASLAIDATGKYLYALGRTSATGPTNFAAYGIDTNTGALSQLFQNFPGPNAGKEIIVEPRGRFLFASAGSGVGGVFSYVINLATGQLTQSPGAFQFGAGQFPFGLATDPTGTFLYSVGNLGGVAGLTIESSSGALAPITGSPFGAGVSGTFLTVEQSGHYLYTPVASRGVLAFSLDAATGVLAPVAGSPFPTAGNSPHGIATTGGAQQCPCAPLANLSPGTLSFPGQPVGTTSAAHTVQLFNGGNAALAISSVAITGPDAANFAQTNNCGVTLAGGGICSINVTFTPPAAGNRTATLTVRDNAAGSPHTAGLTGSTPAVMNVSTTRLDFGGQLLGSASAPLTATVSNGGASPLNYAIQIQGTSAADFVPGAGDTCHSSGQLDSNTNCAMSLVFKPTGVGARSGLAVITANVSGGPTTIILSGTGADFAVTSSSSSATVPAGQAATFTLSVNTMGGPVPNFISFGATGLPTGAAATFKPQTIPAGSTAGSVTLIIATTARSSFVPRLRKIGPPSLPLTGIVVAALLLALLALRRDLHRSPRRAASLSLALLLSLATLSAISCNKGGFGNGAPPPPTPQGTPPGSYPVSIVATSGSSSHNTAITLVVN